MCPRGAGPARLLATGRDLGGGVGYPGPAKPTGPRCQTSQATKINALPETHE